MPDYELIAREFEKAGKPELAAKYRAMAGQAQPSAPAPAPARVERPVRQQQRPAPEPVQFVPPEEQDVAQTEYITRLRADVAAGRESVEELNRATGYTMTEEELAAARPPSPLDTTTFLRAPAERLTEQLYRASVPATAQFMAGTMSGEEAAARAREEARRRRTAAPAPAVVPSPVMERPAPKPITPGLGTFYTEALDVVMPGTRAEERDVVAGLIDLRTELSRLQEEAEVEYVNQGYTRESAKAQAQKDVADVLAIRTGIEGEPVSRGFGVGDYIPLVREFPFYRESRIDFGAEGPAQIREESGALRPATQGEQLRESFARQTLLTPQEAAARRQVRAVEREEAVAAAGGRILLPQYEEELRQKIIDNTDPYFSNLLTSRDPQSGTVIETKLGSFLRSTGLISTIINEAALALPLFYEVDEQGNPVDPNSFAFKANDFVTRGLERMGVSAQDAKDMTSGVVGGSVVPLGLPMPFQPIQRKEPTVIDPTGFRGVSETETFVGDVALSLAKGRFLGDELASMPGYTADLAEGLYANNVPMGTGDRLMWDESKQLAIIGYPLVFGAGSEMVYGIGPFAAAGKVARATGKGIKAASMVGDLSDAATRAQKLNDASTLQRFIYGVGENIEAPIEASKKRQNARIIQDLMDYKAAKPDVDLLLDASEARKVASDTIAKDTLTPYVLMQMMRSNAVSTVGDLRAIAGDSLSGAEFMRSAGLSGLPDSTPLRQSLAYGVPTRMQGGAPASTMDDQIKRAYKEFLRTVHNAEIEAILADTRATDDIKAARIFALLGDSNTVGLPFEANITARDYFDAALLRQQTGQFSPQDAGIFALAAKAVNDPKQADTTAGIIAKFFPKNNLSYPAVKAGSPIYKTLNEFGRALANQGARPLPFTGTGRPVPQVRVPPTPPLRGPLAESYLRRTGGNLPEWSSVAAAPDLYRDAAISAGSRAVEATLENLIPDDLVFVTSTLMAPRQRLTPEVFEAVRKDVDLVDLDVVPQLGPAINGRRTVVYDWTTNDVYGDIATRSTVALGGAEAVRRSPLKKSIIDALTNDQPLTAAQHQVLDDALRTQAFRRVLGTSAKEAVFAGAQTQQARVPTTQLDVLSALEERVPGLATGEARPRLRRSFAEAREPSAPSLAAGAFVLSKEAVGSMLVKAGRQFNKDNITELGRNLRDNLVMSQTPVAFETTVEAAQRRISSIADNFQREVRDEALRTKDPVAAFDAVVARRVARDERVYQESMLRGVKNLMDQGLDEDEAYSILAYQSRAGKDQKALGELIAAEGVVKDAKQLAEKAAYQEMMEDNWASLLQSFFGKELYLSVIGPDYKTLDPYIYRVSPTGDRVPRQITLAEVRDVIAAVRRDNPTLIARGLQRGKLPFGEVVTQLTKGRLRGTDDAVFETLTAWAMDRDKQFFVREAVTDLFDNNPWMVTDLLPTSSAATGGFRGVVEADAIATGRQRVLGGLEALALKAAEIEAAKRSGTPLPLNAAEIDARSRMQARYGGSTQLRDAYVGRTLFNTPKGAEVRVPGTPFMRKMDDFRMDGKPQNFDGEAGLYTSRLDNILVRAYRNLDARTRRELVETVYAKMLAEGTQTPDIAILAAERLDNPDLRLLFFEKKATSEAIARVVSNIQDQAALQGRYSLNPQDAALLSAIEAAKRAGASEFEIVQEMRRALLGTAIESFVLPAAQEMQQNLRAYGWAPDLASSRQDLVTLVGNVDMADPRFVLAGQDFVEDLSKLRVQAMNGELAEKLDTLQRSDLLARAMGGNGNAAGQYVMTVVSDALTLPRTLAAGGLLAGGLYAQPLFDDSSFVVPIPLPNTRYLGVNIMTAPFIAATSLGTMGALRVMTDVGGDVGMLGAREQARQSGRQVAAQAPDFLSRPLVNTLQPGTPTDVLFSSVTGKQWTRTEFFDAVERNSLNLSMGGVEFADAYARDLARDARLTAEGIKAGPLRQYVLRNIDPTRTGIYQYIANSMDRAVRQNVFATALKNGMPEEQAAALARASMLDYGANKYTKFLNKYVMFLAFREAMAREVISSLTRDPSAITRTISLHQDLSKQMDGELQADHAKTRLPFPKTFVFDNTAASRNYGPSSPGLDMYADMAQFAGWVLQTGADDIPPGTLAQAVADESLSPIANYILSDARARPSMSGKGQKVPDEWVAYAIQNSPNGIWPWMKETYNIKPVVVEREKAPGRLTAVDPQAPQLGRTEYRFASPKDHARFMRDLAVLQILGFERTTSDYTKAGLTYGVEDYINPKKRGLPSTLGFLSGLETALGSESPEALVERALREQQQAVRAREPKQ